MLDIAGIAGADRFEEQDLHFLVGDRAMLHAPRHDDELARTDLLDVGAELDPEPAPNAEEELILLSVMMPHEFPLELGQLHVLPIEHPHDAGAPVLANLGELVGQDYLPHVGSSGWGWSDTAEPCLHDVTRPGSMRERADGGRPCALPDITLYCKAL